MKEPKYPDVHVVVTNGNAFAVLGQCRKAARKAGLDETLISQFMAQATKGNYENLVTTAFEWFKVDLADGNYEEDEVDT